MASAPGTCAVRSPLKRANRMEKLVRGTSGGVSAATFRKACESVTTSLGGRLSRASASAQLALLDDQRHGVGVQEVADGLHLRQDEPASGRLLVDRHDQHGQLARAHQVAEDRGVVDEVGGRGVEQRLAEVEHAAAAARPPCARPWRRRCATALTARTGGVARSILLKTTTVGILRAANSSRICSSKSPHSPASATSTPRSVRSKTCRVRCGAQLAEGADVVDAGRVDEQHRAQRQQLHGLLDRVGGGAGLVGDDRDVLPGDGVEQARLADVAPAEQADVQTHALGGADQSCARLLLAILAAPPAVAVQRSGVPSRQTASGLSSSSKRSAATKSPPTASLAHAARRARSPP